MKKVTKGLAISSVAALTALGFSGGAAAQSMTQATMQPINGSGASGTTWIELNGDNSATFTVNMNGVAAGLPHAQHVHFGGTTESPDGPMTPPAEAASDLERSNTTTANAGVSEADGQDVPEGSQIDHNSLTETLEGKPYYGDVQISLTTEGDTSPSSGLAVDRFPAGNDSGSYNYERTIDLTDEQVSQVESGDVEIVVHGADFWGEGAPDTPDGAYSYTFDSNNDGDDNATAAADVYPKSPLADALGAGPLPLEATLPVATGNFSEVPTGSVDTGLGAEATQNSRNLMIASGSALAVATAGAGILAVRRGEEM